MAEDQHYHLARPRSERLAMGKSLRGQVRRSNHVAWDPAPDRPDPLALLQAQDAGRVQHLLPIKYGRMVASPFAFLRGSAAVMAADLAGTPITRLKIMLCGDAHLSNFGVFATPERQLVFDINDFDESNPGPWEWDLKRLAASAVVAGRENEFDDKTNRRLAGGLASIMAGLCGVWPRPALWMSGIFMWKRRPSRRHLGAPRKRGERAPARTELFEYMEVFYNRQRLHSQLGYMSPISFEQHHRLLAGA